MESHAPPGCIHISAATYERLEGKFVCEPRKPIEVKGKGRMMTYILAG
jgi:class 3 adenylate cyclase